MARYKGNVSLYIKMLMFTLRNAQKGGIFGLCWKVLFRLVADYKLLEISSSTKIGGLYLGHCQCITSILRPS